VSKPLFVRVKDDSTGHEFDVREDSALLRREVVHQVKPKLYPPSEIIRAPKHHLSLAAPAAEEAAATGEAPATTTEES
jgi:hypothetical protein